MKALIFTSIAVFFHMKQHEALAATSLGVGAILYSISYVLGLRKKPLTGPQIEDLKFWAIFCLFVGMFVFVWACLYRIYVLDLLF